MSSRPTDFAAHSSVALPQRVSSANSVPDFNDEDDEENPTAHHHHHHRHGSHRKSSGRRSRRRDSKKSSGGDQPSDSESLNYLPLPTKLSGTGTVDSGSSDGSQGSGHSGGRHHKPTTCCGRLNYRVKHTWIGKRVRRGCRRCINKLDSSETLSAALLVFCVVGTVVLFLCAIVLPIVFHKKKKVAAPQPDDGDQ